MKNPAEREVIWINSDQELPPCDGYYWVSNHPEKPFDFGACYYDGFGFVCERIYRNVNWWARMPDSEKRYGKIQ